MAATALERLELARGETPPPTRLLLVGDLPESADEDLVRFLGFPVRPERFGRGAKALRAALGAALDPARGDTPVWLAAVDLRDPATAGLPAPVSDGAVAMRVGEGGPPSALLSLSELPEDSRTATAALRSLGALRARDDPERWRGDFGSSGNGTTGRPVPARPPPPPDGPVSQGAYVPRPRYRESLPSRWRLVGEQCAACGRVGFPPRGRCRECEATEGLRSVRLPTDGGEVVAITTIGPGGQPTEFDGQVASSGPYGVVLVDLAPGARATFQLTDARPGEVAIGSRVGTRLRRLYPMEGEWRYGRKAVPLR